MARWDGRSAGQGDLMFELRREMPRSPGHVFYDRLQSVLIRGRLRRLCLEVELNTALLRGPDGRATRCTPGRFICPDAHWWATSMWQSTAEQRSGVALLMTIAFAAGVPAIVGIAGDTGTGCHSWLSRSRTLPAP